MCVCDYMCVYDYKTYAYDSLSLVPIFFTI